MQPSKTFATNAIHYGYDSQSHEGALVPPLHLSSTFTFATAEEGAARFAGEQSGHFYTRISNPTLSLLEQRIAILEGAEAGLSCASGMGAIASTFWTLLAPNDEIIVDQTLYGCTFALLHEGLAKFGIKVTHVDMTQIEQLQHAISERTKLVYFESPANPNMRLVDIQAVSDIAHQYNAKVMVDNTYCTPYITRPIEHGADLVVHSATKYLGGHGDLVAGLVVGSSDIIQQIRLYGLKDMTGAALSPFNAMLIMRGLKTLVLRMERHTSNAHQVAQMLSQHPAIETLAYPGLETFAQFDLAQRQMDHAGGMLAFTLKGGLTAGVKCMNRCELIQRAVSLGDAESLIQHPASMTHATYTAQQRAEFGISDGLVRLSVGLEGVEDIIADLLQALAD